MLSAFPIGRRVPVVDLETLEEVAVARRSDPERIVQAWKGRTRAWLDGLGEGRTRIDDLMADWAAEAARRGLDRLDRRYWNKARPWLDARVRHVSPAG